GGVMGHSIGAAHDPSAPPGHLPGFAREERVVLRWRRNASERLITRDRHPISAAGVRPVVPHRVVLDAAVVPEGDRVLLPAEAALEQWVCHVLVQIPQDAVALVARNPVYVAGKTLVDVERLFAGHRVGADDRVVGERVALLV